jgi:hypothetical protein
MSTKTTFKRVALVTVAALGFGMLSTVPASAGTALSFALDKSSITIVGTGAGYGIFGITVTSDTAGVGFSAGETITATISAGPATDTDGTAKTLVEAQADWTFAEVKQSAVTTVDPVAAPSNESANATDGALGEGNTGHYAMSADATSTAVAAALIAKKRIYYLKVVVADTTEAGPIDDGVYTVQFDLTNLGGATIQRTTAKIDAVSTAAASGAILAVDTAGSLWIDKAMTLANQNADAYLSASITNRDGGRIVGAAGAAPVLSATITDATTVPVVTTLTAADDGSGTVANDQPDLTLLDGSYSLSAAGDPGTTAGTATITVRYGLAVATGSITVNGSFASAATTGVASITAAGQVDSTDAASVPLTTKSATVSYNVKLTASPYTAQTGYAVYYTLSYGDSCVEGDMTPAAVTAPTKVLTDASGNASVEIKNAYPLTGCAVTVTWSGAQVDDAAQVITWAKPAAASALSNPGGSYQAVVKSAQTVSWTIVDQFGAPVVGASVAISHAGANAPTVAPAILVSDSSGKVTYTWTDAKGVAASTTLGTDTVSVSTVNAVAPSVSAGSVTVTWKTTLSTVASIEAYYDVTATTPTAGSKLVVPTTAIGASAGGLAISAADQLDLTKSPTAAVAAHMVALQFKNLDATDTAVTGIPMTITVTNGHIKGADGKLTASRVLYANEALTVVGTKTGVTTVTATTGTLTSTATILWKNASTDARVLKVVESAGTITATVTDFNGNAVSGAGITASLTAGAGRLGNGATFNTYTTASDGTVSFDVTGAATVTVKIPTTTSTKTLNLAGYGDSTGTVVTTGAPAGVSSVAVTTEGNTVIASSAQSAADAAAEATDAANAATDAANAAAEAADASTAAAQDAADAVTALATQVAEMMDAMKKQITALTNLVIKIQKKVKA